jgi:hypothetical protein
VNHKQAEFVIVGIALFLSVIIFGLSRHEVAAQTDCDLSCLSDKVAALTRRVAALEKAVPPSASTLPLRATAGSSSRAAGLRESFLQLTGGSAAGTDWTKIEGSDVYFDQSLYGNVSAVTWQGWMDNGYGRARLYDETNGRGVDGSEVGVSSSVRASFYSAPMAIWRGQNKYYIQVKSDTGGSVTISSPRIRIVTR